MIYGYNYAVHAYSVCLTECVHFLSEFVGFVAFFFRFRFQTRHFGARFIQLTFQRRYPLIQCPSFFLQKRRRRFLYLSILINACTSMSFSYYWYSVSYVLQTPSRQAFNSQTVKIVEWFTVDTRCKLKSFTISKYNKLS